MSIATATWTCLWVSTPTITFRASGWIVLGFVTGWPPRVLMRRPDGRTGLWSLKTTNCLESINALVEERCAKVDHWQNSSQRHRWLATALLDIEPRLRKVMGYRHLPTLRAALKRELKIDTTTSKKQAA